MPDREKVIKGLECCIPMTLRSGLADCENCPYDRKITIDGGITECCHDLMADTLALLKDAVPVEWLQEKMNSAYEPDSKAAWRVLKMWKGEHDVPD